MPLENISLKKLLMLMYCDERKRTSELRKYIREELRTPEPDGRRGGDFHGDFWSDAKSHVYGTGNLNQDTELRIQANPRRQRLYPELCDGFLLWWNDRRRWRNAPLQEARKLNARLEIEDLGVVVKIQNFMTVEDGFGLFRAIYPYVAEEPMLSDDAARVGFWVMQQAFPAEGLEDFRLLDILRSHSFSINDVPFAGNEEAEFMSRYEFLLAERDRLSLDYQ